MKLKQLADKFAVVKLLPASELPGWFEFGDTFCSVTRTEDEVSIVIQQSRIPENVECEKNLIGLKVLGPLDFSLTGILASLISPLAEARIPVFTIATFETDYIFIHEKHMDSARQILVENGYEFII